jgi:hypothetical protein
MTEKHILNISVVGGGEVVTVIVTERLVRWGRGGGRGLVRGPVATLWCTNL